MSDLDKWAAALARLDVQHFHALDDTEKLYYRLKAERILGVPPDDTQRMLDPHGAPASGLRTPTQD